MSLYDGSLTVLAIDPGKSTGCVLLSSTLPSAIVLSQLTTHNFDMASILFYYPAAQHLVIESPPALGNSPKLVALYGALRHYYQHQAKHLHTISPGQWKPIAKTLKLPIPPGMTRHEKDAYLMAKVWSRTQ